MSGVSREEQDRLHEVGVMGGPRRACLCPVHRPDLHGGGTAAETKPDKKKAGKARRER